MAVIYKTSERTVFQAADTMLEALREIIKRERLNGYTGGIKVWSVAAWENLGEHS